MDSGNILKIGILGRERRRGSKDNLGALVTPLAYPFLNTGTQYSETLPSSGSLGREPPPLDCRLPHVVHPTHQPKPGPVSGEGELRCISIALLTTPGERGEGWVERGWRGMTESRLQNSGGSHGSTMVAHNLKRGFRGTGASG